MPEKTKLYIDPNIIPNIMRSAQERNAQLLQNKKTVSSAATGRGFFLWNLIPRYLYNKSLSCEKYEKSLFIRVFRIYIINITIFMEGIDVFLKKYYNKASKNTFLRKVIG